MEKLLSKYGGKIVHFVDVKIVYGLNFAKIGGDNIFSVYETTGINGLRYVGVTTNTFI